MSLHLFSLCLPLLSAPETVPSSSNSSNTTQTLVPAERGTIGNQTTILSPSVIFLAPVTSQAYPEHLLSSNNLPRNDSLLSIINPARDSNSSSIRTTPTLSRDLRRRRRNERRSRGGESCRQQSKLGIRAQCKQSSILIKSGKPWRSENSSCSPICPKRHPERRSLSATPTLGRREGSNLPSRRET